MLEFCAGMIIGGVCLALLLPHIPFILWALGFVDMGLEPTTPAWVQRVKRVLAWLRRTR